MSNSVSSKSDNCNNDSSKSVSSNSDSSISDLPTYLPVWQ